MNDTVYQKDDLKLVDNQLVIMSPNVNLKKSVYIKATSNQENVASQNITVTKCGSEVVKLETQSAYAIK